jgi:hypothetical protein
LNCRAKPGRQRLTLTSYPRRLFGMVRVEGTDMMMYGTRARMLLGFNRLGPVRFLLGGVQPPGGEGEVVIRFNGEEIGRAQVDAEASEVSGAAAHIIRGVNELEIEAPPGTRLRWLELSGPPTALGL